MYSPFYTVCIRFVMKYLFLLVQRIDVKLKQFIRALLMWIVFSFSNFIAVLVYFSHLDVSLYTSFVMQHIVSISWLHVISFFYGSQCYKIIIRTVEFVCSQMLYDSDMVLYTVYCVHIICFCKTYIYVQPIGQPFRSYIEDGPKSG